MTTIVYGVGDMLCIIGMSPPDGSDQPLPLLGFLKRSSLSDECFYAEPSVEKTAEIIKAVKASGGVIIYFDNPECAERFHSMSSLAFTMACRTDWAERQQASETMN